MKRTLYIVSTLLTKPQLKGRSKKSKAQKGLSVKVTSTEQEGNNYDERVTPWRSSDHETMQVATHRSGWHYDTTKSAQQRCADHASTRTLGSV